MAPPSLAPTDMSPRPAPEAPTTPRPTLSAVARQVGVSLLVACVVPVSLFYSCFVLFGVWPAMGVALAWSYGAIAFRALTGRRTSGLLLLTAMVLTGRTVFALVAHSTFVYFLQPILSDLVVGLVFLLSMVTARPLVARLAGDFYPMDDDLRSRPRVRMLLSMLTALWATVCLTKAVTMFWFLQTQSLDGFVRIQSVATPTANVLAAAATLAAATLVGRREGLLAPASTPLPLPKRFA
jgi:hypothetical protein